MSASCLASRLGVLALTLFPATLQVGCNTLATGLHTATTGVCRTEFLFLRYEGMAKTAHLKSDSG
jgi:hypothetical protein